MPRHGEVFGEFSRYQFHFHQSKREGIPSQWFILDAEQPDELTGKPGVIFQGSEQEAEARAEELKSKSGVA